MRMSPDQHHFQCGCDEGVLEILSKQSQAQSHRPPAKPLERHTIELYCSAMGRSQASERMQRQRLSGSIATENGNDFAGTEIQRQLVDERSLSNAHAYLLCGKS
jgi:hypothetical protein